MYRGKKIALVIPAYKEERLIGRTLSTLPEIIDVIYVVDDKSPDNQKDVILACSHRDRRIKLLRHAVHQGAGGAIITGYLQSLSDNNDIAVVVGADCQMPIDEIYNFLDPIVDGLADYAKGNRFAPDKIRYTLSVMPKTRLVGNFLFTIITKLASGYYYVNDVVNGYTAISRKAICAIDWSKAWKGYGYPLDFLIRLKAHHFTVCDTPSSAIYLKGERQSQINGFTYVLKVSFMLFKGFVWRIGSRKYRRCCICKFPCH